MSSRIKHDDIILLEQPILKVPTDAFRSSLRATQRILERDLDKLNSTLKETPHHQNTNETLKLIDQLITRATTLRRKLNDSYNNPRIGMSPSLQRIKARIDHLQLLYSAEYSSDLTYKKFSQVRLDRHLVDLMLRSGYTQSAQSLSQTAGIEMLTDAPLFLELARIEKALVNHSCVEALAWCKENGAALKKTQSTLEFELRYQEFIELVKAKKFTEAISYSQKQLIPWQSTRLPEISQVMTLLAFDHRTRCPPYARLYDEGRWVDLINNFRSTLFALLSIPEQPFLHLSLSVGLASLKLPACYADAKRPSNAVGEDLDMTPPSFHTRLPSASEFGAVAAQTSSSNSSHHHHHHHHHLAPPASNYDPSLVAKASPAGGTAGTGPQRNVDCPTCDPEGLGELAKECPWSHHVNSIIVCGLTGKVVQDGDGLAVLPNGRVYSAHGLDAAAATHNGIVLCPRTGQAFNLDEIRRVYIS